LEDTNRKLESFPTATLLTKVKFFHGSQPASKFLTAYAAKLLETSTSTLRSVSAN